MTPTPPAATASKRGLRFWLAVGGAALLSCCLLTAVCGALGSSLSSASGKGGAASASPAGESAPTPGSSAGDDVLFRAPNGLEYISTIRVVGPQVLSGAQLLGAWREDHRNLGFQLDPGGQYRMVYDAQGGGAAVSYDERGTWVLEQGALTLTPQSLSFNGAQVNGSRPVHSESTPGPPRTAHLDGLVLEYEPYGVEPKVTKRIDGLHLFGTKPEWYSWNGEMDVTLRRAPAPR